MVNDADIQALVDNELSPEETSIILKHMSKSPRACRRYEELKHQKALLLCWFEMMHLAH